MCIGDSDMLDNVGGGNEKSWLQRHKMHMLMSNPRMCRGSCHGSHLP